MKRASGNSSNGKSKAKPEPAPTAPRRSVQKVAAARPKSERSTEVAALGAEVRRRRMEQGLTLDQLAEEAELTPNYIGTIENGYRDPSLSTLQGLADGLNVSLAELFGPQQALTSSGLEMARLFDDSPEDLQKALLRLLHGLGKKPRA